MVLQTLLVLVKRKPPAGKKLLILGTTSAGEVLDSMDLTSVFNVTLHVPSLRTDEIIRVLREAGAFEVGRLVVLLGMLAAQSEQRAVAHYCASIVRGCLAGVAVGVTTTQHRQHVTSHIDM